MNPEPDGVINGAWMPTVVFDGAIAITYEHIQEAFSRNNIDARVFFHPLSKLSMFTECETNNIARDLSKRAINLPSYHDMSVAEQDRVVAIVKSLIDE